jgi:hypothetical protein
MKNYNNVANNNTVDETAPDPNDIELKEIVVHTLAEQKESENPEQVRFSSANEDAVSETARDSNTSTELKEIAVHVSPEVSPEQEHLQKVEQEWAQEKLEEASKIGWGERMKYYLYNTVGYGGGMLLSGIALPLLVQTLKAREAYKAAVIDPVLNIDYGSEQWAQWLNSRGYSAVPFSLCEKTILDGPYDWNYQKCSSEEAKIAFSDAQVGAYRRLPLTQEHYDHLRQATLATAVVGTSVGLLMTGIARYRANAMGRRIHKEISVTEALEFLEERKKEEQTTTFRNENQNIKNKISGIGEQQLQDVVAKLFPPREEQKENDEICKHYAALDEKYALLADKIDNNKRVSLLFNNDVSPILSDEELAPAKELVEKKRPKEAIALVDEIARNKIKSKKAFIAMVDAAIRADGGTLKEMVREMVGHMHKLDNRDACAMQLFSMALESLAGCESGNLKPNITNLCHFVKGHDLDRYKNTVDLLNYYRKAFTNDIKNSLVEWVNKGNDELRSHDDILIFGTYGRLITRKHVDSITEQLLDGDKKAALDKINAELKRMTTRPLNLDDVANDFKTFSEYLVGEHEWNNRMMVGRDDEVAKAEIELNVQWKVLDEAVDGFSGTYSDLENEDHPKYEERNPVVKEWEKLGTAKEEENIREKMALQLTQLFLKATEAIQSLNKNDTQNSDKSDYELVLALDSLRSAPSSPRAAGGSSPDITLTARTSDEEHTVLEVMAPRRSQKTFVALSAKQIQDLVTEQTKKRVMPGQTKKVPEGQKFSVRLQRNEWKFTAMGIDKGKAIVKDNTQAESSHHARVRSR